MSKQNMQAISEEKLFDLIAQEAALAGINPEDADRISQGVRDKLSEGLFKGKRIEYDKIIKNIGSKFKTEFINFILGAYKHDDNCLAVRSNNVTVKYCDHGVELISLRIADMICEVEDKQSKKNFFIHLEFESSLTPLEIMSERMMEYRIQLQSKEKYKGREMVGVLIYLNGMQPKQGINKSFEHRKGVKIPINKEDDTYFTTDLLIFDIKQMTPQEIISNDAFYLIPFMNKNKYLQNRKTMHTYIKKLHKDEIDFLKNTIAYLSKDKQYGIHHNDILELIDSFMSWEDTIKGVGREERELEIALNMYSKSRYTVNEIEELTGVTRDDLGETLCKLFGYCN